MSTHSVLTNRSSRFIERLRVSVVLLWLSIQFAFDSRDSIVAAENLEAPNTVAVHSVGMTDERLVLTEYLTPRGRPMPPDSQGNDQWFLHVAIIVSDMDRAYQRQRENKVVHVSTEPQTLPDWNRSAAGIRAF